MGAPTSTHDQPLPCLRALSGGRLGQYLVTSRPVRAERSPGGRVVLPSEALMLDTATIEAAAARLAAATSTPSRIILFGSYARGTADQNSDVDLLVTERELADRAAEYMRLRDALGRLAPGIGIDLLLCEEREYLRRSQVPGSLWYRARLEGKVLHDSL